MANKSTSTLDDWLESDTIIINTSDLENDLNFSNMSLTGATGATGSSGSFFTAPYSYGTININSTAGINGTYSTVNSSSPGLHVKGDSEFEGDLKVNGRSLSKTLDKIADRLAILEEPDPARLEKYAALKKAYENYKMLDRLIGEDSNESDEK
jgi:hypothetical protein